MTVQMRTIAVMLFIIGSLHAAASTAQQRPIAADHLRSGSTYGSADLRSLQADDFQNPGMLWVERGARLWREPAGDVKAACAGCHNDARQTMRGVATRYPRFDPKLGRLVNLEGRVNACRVDQQRAQPLEYETDDLIGLTAYVAHQSRGLSIAVAIDDAARPSLEAGRQLYGQRVGQINLACMHCHDERAGQRLLAETIRQGHGNAYPIYRLEWQKAGSLQRRLRACLSGVRAEMWPYGAQEYLQLELYLAWRASGLAIETPGVRR